jgi:hypothetical protein
MRRCGFRHVLGLAVGIGVASMPLGCAETGGPGFETDATAAPEVPASAEGLDDFEFVHSYLIAQPTVTVDDAYRAMLILADGEDTAAGFDARRADLEGRGIARAAWGLQADRPIDKGSVAYMVCQILQLQGGVNRIVFGSWGLGDRRYALRELVYRDLMARSPAYRYITGAELANLLRKADEIMQKKGMYGVESVEIGPPPAPGEPLPGPGP